MRRYRANVYTFTFDLSTRTRLNKSLGDFCKMDSKMSCETSGDNTGI